MEKFPEDVRTAETRTDGDPDIIDSKEFQPEKKPNIASIFGDQSAKIKKGVGRGRPRANPIDEDIASYSRPVAKVNEFCILTNFVTIAEFFFLILILGNAIEVNIFKFKLLNTKNLYFSIVNQPYAVNECQCRSK